MTHGMGPKHLGKICKKMIHTKKAQASWFVLRSPGKAKFISEALSSMCCESNLLNAITKQVSAV